MKAWMLIVLSLFTFISVNGAEQTGREISYGSGDEDYGGKVVVIKVGEDSLVNSYSFKYWRKILKRADEQKAKAVVFDIDTPGGYAIQTADLITRVMPDLSIPSIAYVNMNATSAGSMVAFGCDKIYMHPRGTIGSTGIVAGGGQEIDDVMRAKIESLFKSYVKIVAKEKGRNPDVMNAMMFKDKEYSFADGKIIVAKGDLLNLTADEASLIVDGKPLLADGICEDLLAVLEREGLSEASVVLAEPTGLDAFASWVGIMSPLLISVGMIAVFLELKTPGVGIFGLVAAVAFSLFFVGNNLDGNVSGFGLAALFVIGLLLVILEFFVIPGTFVAGTIGVLMMLASLTIAMVDTDVLDSFKNSDIGIVGVTLLLGWPLVYLSIGTFGAGLLAMLVMRFLPSMPMYGSLSVSARLEPGMGVEEESTIASRVGKTGVAVTELRPAGKVDIEGELVDVISERGFVAKGDLVRVISADGMRILVELER